MHDLSDTQTQLLTALRRGGPATGRQLADQTGLAYSTVTRLLRELATLNLASRDNDTAGRGKSPARWRATPTAAPHAGPQPATAGPPQATEPDPAGANPATATGRLGKGELRAHVLTVLRAHPGEDLGPTQIAKNLAGRSQGAIANACDRLVAEGLAHLTNDKPRRYTATNPAAATSGG